MNYKSFFKHLGNAITNILVVISLAVLALSLFTAYQFRENPEEAYLFGYKPVLVLTGSMEPTMKVNGVAIVKKATFDEVKEDDILMYQIGDKMITHRIIEKTDKGIVTKGDNNNSEDAYVLTDENVKAKVVAIWNWTHVPLDDIFPEGFGNEVNKRGIIKWVGFPIFVIIVLKLLSFVIKKVNKMDFGEDKKESIEVKEITPNEEKND